MARLVQRLVLVFFAAFPVVGAPRATAEEERAEAVAETREEYLRWYGQLAEAVAQFELNSADPIDRRRLFEAALRGMAAEVDQYSAYLSPDEYTKLKELARRSPVGFGLELAIEQGRLAVLGVHAGSPAERAGLAPGMRLLSIDALDVDTMTLSEAERLLADHAGAVKLTLQPPEGPPREFELRPARTAAPTVVGARLYGEVGYVRISRFGGDTAADLKAALQELLEEGARSVVIDARFNSGGLLDSAVSVADLFLERGEIVTVAARRGDPRTWEATSGDVLGGKPVVVLVNRYSASGSEVLAAALKDNGRARVAGERSWGKGSVQSIIPLGDHGAALKLTTARYLRPSGANIHRSTGMTESDEWGVSPSEGCALSLSNDQGKTLLASWRSEEETPEPDGQLALAIELLTGGDAP